MSDLKSMYEEVSNVAQPNHITVEGDNFSSVFKQTALKAIE